MDRVPSADDLMSALMWRTAHHAHQNGPNGGQGNALTPGVARTPSQNEMESYYAAMMANAAAGGSGGAMSEQFFAGLGGASGSAPNSREGTPGIPRVASIDVLRKMIIGGGYGGGAVPGQGNASPGSMTPTTAPAISGFASGANLSALGQLGAAAAEAAAQGGETTTTGRGAKRGAKKAAAKAPPAKKAKAAVAKSVAKGKNGVSEKSVTKGSTELDDDHDSDGQSHQDGDGTNDLRRQRRMLSNRESARRSRRRKLEHVATLESKIARLQADWQATLHHARAADARVSELVRENAAIRAERDRLLQILREQGPPGGNVTTPKTGTALERKSSLQRISSNGDLKGELGKGSPTIGSGSGFVPFRSLQSYENLLALQEAKEGKK